MKCFCAPPQCNCAEISLWAVSSQPRSSLTSNYVIIKRTLWENCSVRYAECSKPNPQSDTKLYVIHLDTKSSRRSGQILRFSFYNNIIFPNLRSFLFLSHHDQSKVIYVLMQQSEMKHIIHQQTVVYFHNYFISESNNRKSIKKPLR